MACIIAIIIRQPNLGAYAAQIQLDLKLLKKKILSSLRNAERQRTILHIFWGRTLKRVLTIFIKRSMNPFLTVVFDVLAIHSWVKQDRIWPKIGVDAIRCSKDEQYPCQVCLGEQCDVTLLSNIN